MRGEVWVRLSSTQGEGSKKRQYKISTINFHRYHPPSPCIPLPPINNYGRERMKIRKISAGLPLQGPSEIPPYYPWFKTQTKRSGKLESV
jgi:hypothetical protein